VGVNPPSESQPEGIALTEVLAGIFAKPALMAMLLVVFMTGLCVAGTALHDPDSCWLMAVGRYMVRHHCLPSTDPFSYTFALQPGLPFVMYQWLTEIIFYLAYRLGHLPAVLALIAMVTVSAFVVLPLKLLKHGKVPMFAAFGLVVLGLLASAFRFLARPEIFSFIFAAAWLYNLAKRRMRLENSLIPQELIGDVPTEDLDAQAATRTCQNCGTVTLSLVLVCPKCGAVIADPAQPDNVLIADRKPGAEWQSGLKESGASEIDSIDQSIDWRFIGRSVFLIVPWCNFHTGFISGLFLLLFYVLGTAVGAFVVRRRKVFDQTAFLALLASIAATLINPYGIKLWLYIPLLFFAPFNELITELKPLVWTDLTYHPFIALFFLSILMLFKSGAYGRRRHDEKGFIAATIISATIIAAVSFEAFLHRRLIPFTVLVLLAEFAIMFNRSRRQRIITRVQAAEKPRTDDPYGWIYNPNQIKWTFVILVLAVAGALTCSLKIVTPELPQSSGAFTAPIKAVEFLSKHDNAGRTFNDAQFGDVMIWHSPANPKVFIDTRYDMYGPKIVHDYYVLRGLKPGWQEVIDSYQIKLIIFPTKMDIIQKLSQNPDWCTIYADDIGTILQLKSSMATGETGADDMKTTKKTEPTERTERNQIAK
jgi:uncharacterized membrane protein